MKRSRKIGLVLLAIGVAISATLVLTPTEPSHDGKTLSEWLNEIDVEAAEIDTNSPAAHAIHAIGTNALPHVLQRLHTRDSPIREELNNLLANVPVADLQVPIASPHWSDQIRVAYAIHFLGPLAKPIIPELSAMATNYMDTHAASIALAGIQPEGTDVLVGILTNKNSNAVYFPSAGHIRSRALYGLGHARLQDNHQISIILEYIRDPQLRGSAIMALGTARQDPNRTIPILVSILETGDKFDQLYASTALFGYGKDAKQAIPALLTAYSTNSNEFIYMAIEQIDPDALPTRRTAP